MYIYGLLYVYNDIKFGNVLVSFLKNVFLVVVIMDMGSVRLVWRELWNWKEVLVL